MGSDQFPQPLAAVSKIQINLFSLKPLVGEYEKKLSYQMTESPFLPKSQLADTNLLVGPIILNGITRPPPGTETITL